MWIRFVETRATCWVSFLGDVPGFWDLVSPWDSGLINRPGCLASEPLGPAWLRRSGTGITSTCHSVWLFDMGSGNPALVPVLWWPLLYWLSHHPSPIIAFTNNYSVSLCFPLHSLPSFCLSSFYLFMCLFVVIRIKQHKSDNCKHGKWGEWRNN